MKAIDVVQRLRAHEQELRGSGIASLTLFGSVARGEPSPHDVDLAAEFDRSKRVTLLKMSAIQRRLTELVGVEVDLTEMGALKNFVRQSAERDFVLVF